MLTSLDHVVILTDHSPRTVDAYKTLLGQPPQWESRDNQMRTSYFQTENIGLEIIGPDGPHAYDYVRDLLKGKPAALTSLAFAADDLDSSHHILARRGLNPSEITESRNGRRKFRCPDEVCHGIKTFILSGPSPSGSNSSQSKMSLDHIVINTPNPDRAIAHYGARLGIRFALDRTNNDWGARFLFFKLDDVVLEVIHRLGKTQDPTANDETWGLTWKVDDLEKHWKRLRNAEVETSDIRTGRKPGTRVFTVKSHTDGIPTLFLEQTQK